MARKSFSVGEKRKSVIPNRPLWKSAKSCCMLREKFFFSQIGLTLCVACESSKIGLCFKFETLFNDVSLKKF